MILRCSCTHSAQDGFHGDQMRVHNSCGSDSQDMYRCTICKTERGPSATSSLDTKKKKKK